jgi:hypothetical protein
MNLQVFIRSAVFGGSAQIRMALALEVKCIPVCVAQNDDFIFKLYVQCMNTVVKLFLPVHQRVEPGNGLGFEFVADRLERATRFSSVSKVVHASILAFARVRFGCSTVMLYTHSHSVDTALGLEFTCKAHLPLSLLGSFQVTLLVHIIDTYASLGCVVRKPSNCTRYTGTSQAMQKRLDKAHEDRKFLLGVESGKSRSFAQVSA